MQYLKAHAMICLKHSEKDCRGCPFRTSMMFGMDTTDSCSKFIFENPEKAKQLIDEYFAEDWQKKNANLTAGTFITA